MDMELEINEGMSADKKKEFIASTSPVKEYGEEIKLTLG
jgi:hypothetical protein